ncbi:MAG: phage head closure protein [Alphaproteobacteria bacterium]|nr:phage head closure protein [Alphaproteobacteria bacterium]
MGNQVFTAGRLRERVTIQQPVETADTAGGVTVSWNDVATVWAEVTPLTGTESVVAAKLQSGVSHRVVVRYRSGVTARHRLSFGGRVFAVQAVFDVEERGEFLELLVREGVGS